MRLKIVICFLLLFKLYLKGNKDSSFIQRKLAQFDSALNVNYSLARIKLNEINKLNHERLSPQLKAKILLANSKWHLGLKSCDSSLSFARQATKICAEPGSLSGSIRYLGNAYRCLGISDSALLYYLEGLRLAGQVKDTLSIAMCHFNIGNLYSEMHDYKKAKGYFLAANGMASRTGNEKFLAMTGLALANNMADNNQETEAIPVLEKTLLYYQKTGQEMEYAQICNNLAIIYQHLKIYKKAFTYYNASLQVNIKTGNLEQVAREYNNLGTVLINRKNYQEAISMLFHSEEATKKSGISNILPEVYHNLSYCYEQTKNYALAFRYKNAEKQLADSLRSLEMLKNTERLQEEFEAEKRSLEISSLKKENEVKELKSQAHLKQRNGFIALAVGLFGIALLIFFFLRQRVLNARQLNEKNLQIHQQQLDEVIRKSELQSIHTMIETQEKERRRIAQDLHDRVGSMLSTVKLQFGHFNSTAKTDKEHINKVSHLLDDAVEEIRQVSHNLVSGVLSTFGLTPALKDLIQALKDSSGLEINLQVYGMEERMESEMEINLYRILQELFNNTVRHAKATRVDIELSRHPGELNLMYSDNGTGFDTAAQKQGIGLKNINARVDKLGGSLHIDSGKGNGSTFVFNFPLT